MTQAVYARLLTTAAAQESGPQTLLPKFEEVAAAVEKTAPNLASAIRAEAIGVITGLLISNPGGGLSLGLAAETHAKLTEWLGIYPETDLPGAFEARIVLGTLAKLTKPTL